MKAKSKSWYQSKIVWAGAIAVLSAIGDALMAGDVSWRQCAVAGFGALVIYLRTLTTAEIGK